MICVYVPTQPTDIAVKVQECRVGPHVMAGALNSDGTIDNVRSTQRLAEVALAYAQAGWKDLYRIQ